MMALYFNKIKKYRLTVFVLVIILAFQACFALAVPYFTGQLIGTGIQQKGIDTRYPDKLTEKAISIFSLVLPDEEFEYFCNCYIKEDIYYKVSENIDPEKAEEIYRNGILSGFYIALDKAENRLSNLDSDTVESMMNLATVGNLYSALKNFDSISESEKNDYYLKAKNAPESLKGQLAGIAMPYFYSDAGYSVKDIQKDFFIRCGIFMVVFVILQTICFIISGKLSAKVSSRIQKELRHDLLMHTTKFSNKERKLIKKDLYDVFASDVSNAGTVTDFLFSAFLYSPFILIGGIILSFRISLTLSAVVILTVLAATGIIFIIYKTTLPAYDRLQHYYGILARSVKTAVSQLYTVRTMQTENFERERYLSASDSVRKNEFFVLKSVFNALSFISLLSNIITAIAVLASGKSLLSADLRTGDIIAFLQYSILTVSAVTTLAAAFLFAPRAKKSFDNIDEIMSIEIDRKSFSDGSEINGDIQSVEFRDVSLDNGLKNISFTAERGSITAITGPTGCGKTSLLRLLTDLSEKASGEIMFNGISADKIRLDSIRKRVSFANSIPMIFSSSLMDNMINYGAENEDMMDEAMRGCAVDFIEDKNVILHNGASRFSGGQRSRIALACALSKKADIFIIDDCLRAVDAETENKILMFLRKLSRKSAVIIVSSRINTLMQANKIIVLSENSVQATGTHNELIKTCDFYRELALLQGTEVNGSEN